MLGLRLDVCICALAVLGVAGCDNNSKETDPAQLDAQRLVPELCEVADHCECANDLADGDCLARRTSLWEARVAEGRRRDLTYDLECFEAKVAEAAEYECWAAYTFDAHLCEKFCAVFHGDKELGEACEGYDENVSNCAQGLMCEQGRCVAPCSVLTGLREGQQCMTEDGNEIEPCAEGLNCDWNTLNCVKLPQVGEFCEGDCGYGAYCDWNQGRCLATVGLGGNCNDAECSAGLYCHYEYTGEFEPSATCQQYALEGESCANDQRCDAGLGCGSLGICQGPGQDGEPCDAAGCASGLWCDWEVNICRAGPEVEGAPCLEGVCSGDLWCDTQTDPMLPACRARIPNGERCAGHSQCESGFCPNAFCFERPALGEECPAGICAPGLACDGAGFCVESFAIGPAVCSYRGF